MTSYVYPGCGYGGYCLPKDTNALLAQAKEKGYEPAILREVITVNDTIAERIAERIIRAIPEDTVEETPHIGILGLSFKPGSDDVRDTPAARIIRQLKAKGYDNILAYDPVAEEEFVRVYPDINLTICDTKEEVYEGADVLAIVTAWEDFRDVKEATKNPVVDCRYML